MKSYNIVGNNKKSIVSLKKLLKRLGFVFNKKKPDMIISLGGDGTFLFCERKFPGVPKLLIKDSQVCSKCQDLKFDEIFMKILLNNYIIINHIKLIATFNKKKYIATNDFIIRNKTPTHAIRFQVTIDHKESSTIIGDGVVFSTPFGSTGYHHSITRKKFDKGIGIAYNNTTKEIKHKILHENSIIKMKILRHNAHFGVDNDPKIMTIKEGQTIKIQLSKKVAKVIRVI
jgi:NAD kinase